MPLLQNEFEEILISRQILYFSCPELNTPKPHYFICICRQPEDIIILSCCTSRFETVEKLIERGRFPNEKLVYIPSSDLENLFTKNTYVNCNEYFTYTIEDVWKCMMKER